jgi:hypothetical protein
MSVLDQSSSAAACDQSSSAAAVVHRPTTPTQPPATGLLLATPCIPDTIDYDLSRRYAQVAALLDRLCRDLPEPVRLLEVGCGVTNLLPGYFDAERVQVVRCDLLPVVEGEPGYVQLDPDQPLPFATESMDAVCALEVLEHLPAAKRQAFLAECLRVARRGCVWTCPDGRPEVESAEQLADAAYFARHGRAHPYLREHREFGLPTVAQVSEWLRQLDCPFAVFDGTALSDWLASVLLTEPLAERHANPLIWRMLRDTFTEQENRWAGVAYRKVYVAAKHFNASAALEADPLPAGGAGQPAQRPDGSAGDFCDAEGLLPSRGALLSPAQAGLLRTAEIASQALSLAENAWQAEFRQRTQLEQTIRNQPEAPPDSEPAERWQAERQQLLAEVDAWSQRAALLDYQLQQAQRSWGYRVGGVFRRVRRWLRPRTYTLADARVWRDLAPSEAGFWQATGSDPQLILPCDLPAGEVQWSLHLVGPELTLTELFADYGEGFTPANCLGRYEWRGELRLDLCLHLAKPTRALRLDPASAPGPIRVAEWRVRPA